MKNELCMSLIVCIILPFASCKHSATVAEGSSHKKVFIVTIVGEINNSQVELVKRAVNAAKGESLDLIIFEIDTPGGESIATFCISTYIFTLEVPAVAFVSPSGKEDQFNGACSAGALVAMSAKRIYMYPGSIIGSFSPMLITELPPTVEEKFVSAYRTKFGSVAEANSYPKNLAMAMVDKDWEVYKVTVDGKMDFLTMNEVERYRNDGKSVSIKYKVKEKGKLLCLTAKDAVEYNIAKAVIKDRKEIYKDYGIENPQEIQFSNK